MNSEKVKAYFSLPDVVFDYARAVSNVGLWASERAVFEKFFDKNAALLELGCGAGRIALNLEKLGFSNITASDLSPDMIDIAKNLALDFNSKVRFLVQDACSLDFPDSSFDAAIFGFNGLMQIPRRQMRLKALREIWRVLRDGSCFAFTTHDRDAPKNAHYWRDERKRWDSGLQNPELEEFGDIRYRDDRGELFIHSPSRSEVESDLRAAGFSKVFEARRRDISAESQSVLEFSDDCIFWVFKK